jgi:hypothetical protein
MIPRMNINIQDLAHYIFQTNIKEQNEIFLDIKTLKTNKELFFFCFELFCKGLIILYGNSQNKLLLNQVTMEQFDVIKERLRYAHIKLHIHVYEQSTAEIMDLISTSDERDVICETIDKLVSSEEDKQIEDYTFNIMINGVVYVIYFTIE